MALLTSERNHCTNVLFTLHITHTHTHTHARTHAHTHAHAHTHTHTHTHTITHHHTPSHTITRPWMNPETHSTLDHLFSLMFDSLLSPPSAGAGSSFSLPGQPATPQLKLPTNIKVWGEEEEEKGLLLAAWDQDFVLLCKIVCTKLACCRE